MNKFLVLSSLFIIACARPEFIDNDGTVSVTQSSLGTYKYIVDLKDSSRTEERLADGTVFGSYTVLGADGLPQTFKYTAGVDGFKIIEGPLPVAPVDNGVAPLPVQETPEVIAARQTLLLPVTVSNSGFSPGVLTQDLPVPVEDTPEVRAAKEAFFAIHRAAIDAAATA